MGDSSIKREIRIEAQIANLDTLLALLRADMQKAGCPLDKRTVVEICAEEIFVNIASYAYGESGGEATILEEIGENDISLCFKDQGMPYDPLKKEDPDTTLSAQERQIGGLGVFFVKKMMEQVSYEYKDGFNCLTMKLTW